VLLAVTAAGLPETSWVLVFTGPLRGPFERQVRIPGGSPGLGPRLMQILDLTAAAAQQPDHVAVAEVKLHRLITGFRG
jgi:hypothetical protein